MTKLKLLRMKRGLTQEQMASILEIAPTFLSRLECGWFARCPGDLESKFQEIFGEEWTFARLMRPVPDIAADDSDAA